MSLSIEAMSIKGASSLLKNPTIGLHEIHEAVPEADVFIAGSGPIGATFAKLCVDAGLRVIMVELGAADSFRATTKPNGGPEAFVPGYHKKNQIEFQKDIDRFVHVIKAALQPISVVVRDQYVPNLDPHAWVAKHGESAISLGKNPHQDAFFNLQDECITRGVGGMATHWTCATPRLHPPMDKLPNIGRPKLKDDPAEDNKEWDALYREAEILIGTKTDQFDKSIRHNLVLRTLRKAFEGQDRVFRPLPLACHRFERGPEYVEWHSAEDIFRHIYNDVDKRKLFTLLTNHRCTRFSIETANRPIAIQFAEVRDLLAHRGEGWDGGSSEDDSYIKAKVFITAAGAIGTPQILFNSGFSGSARDPNPTSPIPNLGKYITEQPMTFCQVVMNQEVVDSVDDDSNPPWWKAAVKKHREENPKDAIHIPFRDLEPQVTTPFSEKHPWHTQIHRDAFSYGAVGPEVDSRLVVDFRFFGAADPQEINSIKFETDIQDAYGLPQPTFHYRPSVEENERAHRMMNDMCDVADRIGGYLPISPPQFMNPGLALHLGGSTRVGPDQNTTVADNNSKVWNFQNLYVGGNNVIRTGFGENPTLTSMCYAIKSARSIILELKKPKLFVLRHVKTGTVLSVTETNLRPGTEIFVEKDEGALHQRWEVPERTVGTSRIICGGNIKLGAGYKNEEKNEPLVVTEKMISWKLEPAGFNPHIFFISTPSGLVVELSEGKAILSTKSEDLDINQHWSDI